MQIGDKVRLMDGTKATITGVGIGDFIGDPFPVYLTTATGKAITLMSSALKARKRSNRPRGQSKEGSAWENT